MKSFVTFDFAWWELLEASVRALVGAGRPVESMQMWVAADPQAFGCSAAYALVAPATKELLGVYVLRSPRFPDEEAPARPVDYGAAQRYFEALLV